MDIRLVATSNGREKSGTVIIVSWLLWSVIGFLFWVAVIAAAQYAWGLIGVS